jgi:hypothetical protein
MTLVCKQPLSLLSPQRIKTDAYMTILFLWEETP